METGYEVLIGGQQFLRDRLEVEPWCTTLRCGQIARVDIEHDGMGLPSGRARIRFADAAAAKNALQLSGEQCFK